MENERQMTTKKTIHLKKETTEKLVHLSNKSLVPQSYIVNMVLEDYFKNNTEMKVGITI